MDIKLKELTELAQAITDEVQIISKRDAELFEEKDVAKGERRNNRRINILNMDVHQAFERLRHYQKEIGNLIESHYQNEEA